MHLFFKFLTKLGMGLAALGIITMVIAMIIWQTNPEFYSRFTYHKSDIEMFVNPVDEDAPPIIYENVVPVFTYDQITPGTAWWLFVKYTSISVLAFFFFLAFDMLLRDFKYEDGKITFRRKYLVRMVNIAIYIGLIAGIIYISTNNFMTYAMGWATLIALVPATWVGLKYTIVDVIRLIINRKKLK